MIDSLLTLHLHCRLRTDSADLLRKSKNAPLSSARLQPKRTHVLELSCRIKTLDVQNHRIEQTIPSERCSNPHSSVETTQRHLLRPRGFLP